MKTNGVGPPIATSTPFPMVESETQMDGAAMFSSSNMTESYSASNATSGAANGAANGGAAISSQTM